MMFDQSKLIAVVGGGNIGTQFACAFADAGYKVNLLVSDPSIFDGELEIVDESDNITRGTLNKVTSSYEDAVKDATIIFVTHPAFRLKTVAEQLLPFIDASKSICVVPGTGGAEFSFSECVRKGAGLYGLQRVPCVARLVQRGKRVRCEGLRLRLHIGEFNGGKADELCRFFEQIWHIPCDKVPNYLNITLTPSNPILHTTRLKTLFGDYQNNRIYDKNPLFYGEWSDESSRLLLACDDELQNVVKLLDKMDLSYVKSLKIHYESNTAEELTAKMQSIKSLHNLTSPMKQVEGGWIPDFGSRYFTADFPYGLAIIEEICALLNYDAPNIRETMAWYRTVTGDNRRLELSDYNIRNVEDLYAFYR